MDWIEQLTGWDPDHGSGLLELGLIGLVGAIALLRSQSVRGIFLRPFRRGTSRGEARAGGPAPTP